MSDTYLAETHHVLKAEITKIEACFKIFGKRHKMQTLCFLSIVV